MKRLNWQIGLAALLLALGNWTSAVSAAPDPGASGERLERLEQRVNQMAERQEQFMQRFAGSGDQRREERTTVTRDRTPRPGMGDLGAPGPFRGEIPPPMAPAGGSSSQKSKAMKDLGGLIGLCLLVGFIFNILVAIWIFSDIRKRGEGSGIFVVLALLAGIPAGVIYALARIGDRKL